MRLKLRSIILLVSIIIMVLSLFSWAAAMQARTETNCNFGMVKGQKSGSCQVPIPSGCSVANFPGLEQHWVDVSKGGNTQCKFDEKRSDWKTTIIGTCAECTTDHCSARFSVMFNCASTMKPPKMQRPAQ